MPSEESFLAAEVEWDRFPVEDLRQQFGVAGKSAGLSG